MGGENSSIDPSASRPIPAYSFQVNVDAPTRTARFTHLNTTSIPLHLKLVDKVKTQQAGMPSIPKTITESEIKTSWLENRFGTRKWVAVKIADASGDNRYVKVDVADVRRRFDTFGMTEEEFKKKLNAGFDATADIQRALVNQNRDMTDTEEFDLARAYESKNSIIGGPDLKQAMKWYEAAAEHGNYKAQMHLGKRYLSQASKMAEGEEKKQLQEKAVNYLREAAIREQEDVTVDWNALTILRDIDESFGQHPDTYLSNLVHYSLGRVYEEGGQNDKAAEYYASGVEKGYAPALYSLGKMKEDGKFSSPNMGKPPALYYLAAARKGHAAAQNRMGELLEANALKLPEGEKLTTPLQYFEQAAKQGNEDALINLKRLLDGNSTQETDVSTQIEGMRNMTPEEVLGSLGDLYYKRSGPAEGRTEGEQEKNRAEAISCFKKIIQMSEGTINLNTRELRHFAILKLKNLYVDACLRGSTENVGERVRRLNDLIDITQQAMDAKLLEGNDLSSTFIRIETEEQNLKGHSGIRASVSIREAVENTFLLEGQHTLTKDPSRAIGSFAAAATLGSKQAVAHLRSLSQKGNVQAQMMLASFYQSKYTDIANQTSQTETQKTQMLDFEDTAIKYWTQAASQGEQKAVRALALMHVEAGDRFSSEGKLQEAIQCYERGATPWKVRVGQKKLLVRDNEALFKLADLHLKIKSKDPSAHMQKAIKALQQAAKQGHGPSQLRLGIFYLEAPRKNSNAERQATQGIKYLMQAVQSGDQGSQASAYLLLGEMYLQRLAGKSDTQTPAQKNALDKMTDEMARVLEETANQEPKGLAQKIPLAEVVSFGEGEEQNLRLKEMNIAIDCLQRAAQRGDVRARERLMKTDGTNQSIEQLAQDAKLRDDKALNALQAIAEGKLTVEVNLVHITPELRALAQYKLGSEFEERGEIDRAVWYYKEAGVLKNKEAIQRLTDLTESTEFTKSGPASNALGEMCLALDNSQAAFVHFQDGAKRNHAAAAYHLGQIYEKDSEEIPTDDPGRAEKVKKSLEFAKINYTRAQQLQKPGQKLSVNAATTIQKDVEAALRRVGASENSVM